MVTMRLVGLLLALTLFSIPALAEKRVALLIGNEAYESEIGRLANPHNDVAVLEQALKGLGFDVVTVRDAGLGALTRAVNAYARRLQDAGPSAIGFFYYSGHGASDGSTNYLIPIDVKTTETGELWDQSLQLTEITRKLKRDAGNATHFVVFDACRNTLKLTKPGSRAVVQSKGFVPVAQENGMLIAYATAEGELATDVGAGAGPYAKVLAEEMVKPGTEAVVMFRAVQLRVRAAIHQEPYVGFSALGNVYLAGKGEQPTAPPISQQKLSEAAEAWDRTKDTTNVAVLEAFVARYKDTFYAELARARLDEVKKKQVVMNAPSKSQDPQVLARPPAVKPVYPARPITVTSMDDLGPPFAPLRRSPEGRTLQQVRARGSVACGVSIGVPGFASPDEKGQWTGLDVHYCRAVAAAIFGDGTKVTFKPLTARERFTALQTGEVDILSRNTTWTMTRDSALGLSSVGVLYYDGQGFMVRKKLGVNSAKELNGATVCVMSGTTTELNLAYYFRNNNMSYKPIMFEKADEVIAAYEAGRCDVYTTDQSALYVQRQRLISPDDHVVLPEVISKEPLGPYVRWGDDQWLKIGRWTLYALISADEFGVTSANVDQSRGSPRLEVRRLLGNEGDIGAGFALSPSWAYNIVKAVGNYGEIFERSLGTKSSLKIPRGLNAQWSKGGLMFAPPFL